LSGDEGTGPLLEPGKCGRLLRNQDRFARTQWSQPCGNLEWSVWRKLKWSNG
jgi:hypothetical protein